MRTITLGAGTNVITVTVMDSGSPALGAARDFTVRVISGPVITSIVQSGETVVINWSSIVGGRYRLQYKSRLEEESWHDLPGEIVADGSTTTRSDSVDEDRFYRVQVVP